MHQGEKFKSLEERPPLDIEDQSAALYRLSGSGKTQAALSPEMNGEHLLQSVRQWMESREQVLLVVSVAPRIQNFLYETLINVDMGVILLLVTNWFIGKILDNADSLKLFQAGIDDDVGASPDLSHYIPRGISILWTSRNANIVGSLVEDSQGIEVGAMTDEEALLLLRRPPQGKGDIGPGSEPEIELLECLKRLPLAIAHAAAFMRQTSKSATEYL